MFPISLLYRHTHPRLLSAGAVVMCAVLLGGCATTRHPAVVPLMPAAPVALAPTPIPSPDSIPVTRYGRYTLVELVPDRAQRDLMQQVVDITMPSAFDATVGDALRYVLLRSGYRLCDNTAAVALYALPLPAAHLRLGPLSLHDALLTLAGPAWDVSIDEPSRQVCFSRHAAPPLAAPAPAPVAPAVAPAGIDLNSIDAFHPWGTLP